MGSEIVKPDCLELLDQFNRETGRNDAAVVAKSLSVGLNVLRESLYFRMHQDVENSLGTDSMLMPISEAKTQLVTRHEIDVYQVAESAIAVRDFGYLPGREEWFVRWLIDLRLEQSPPGGKMLDRLNSYLANPADERRLSLTNVLARVLPESSRAPLVLFHLFPLAVQIATALAFSDRERTEMIRAIQADLLPAIKDCRRCHARILDNAEQCQECGNPLWKSSWLASTD